MVWCKSLKSNGSRGINAFCNIFSLTAERVNHELENVNLAAWKITKSEDPGLGNFAIVFTAAGIVSSLSNKSFNEAVTFLKGKDPKLWTHVEEIVNEAFNQFQIQEGPDMQADCFRNIALSVVHTRDYLQSKLESFTQTVGVAMKIEQFINTLTNSISFKDPHFHSDLIRLRSLRESLTEAGTQFFSTQNSAQGFARD